MRTGLAPADLGDLFDRPLAATISLTLRDGSVFSRPVWHMWEQGRFVFAVPAGDRKIAMLERDRRVTVLLAENGMPFRAIEVRGKTRITTDGYRDRGAALYRRYVDAYDPETPVEAYLTDDPGVIVEVDADRTTIWDFADNVMVPG